MSSDNIPAEDVVTDPSGRVDPTSPISSNVVETWGLSKRYGYFDALSDCSVRVTRGEIFGLLGPNGAGKTTLIRLLLGLLRPTKGRCEVDGISPQRDGVGLRERVSYLPGDARLPRHMRGSGVIRFFAQVHPYGDLDRSLQFADRFELDTRRHVAFMSTGMRQKLALAVVLGPRTPLLVLDEPTANLDPTIRASVLDCVRDARDEGRTVMLSSHVMNEIEETCDRVAFLRHGELAHELVMSELFQRHRVSADTPKKPITIPNDLNSKIKIRQPTSRFSRIELDTAGDLAPLLAWLDSLQLKRVRVEPLGLRAVYDSVHEESIPSRSVPNSAETPA